MPDSSKAWNFHFQQTVITQYHPEFTARYTGPHSMRTTDEAQTSLTSTFFVGARLWKGAEFYANPELAGGSGLSKALGVAGFPNGETFRIGDPKPQAYMARLFITQYFALGKKKEFITDDINQLQGNHSSRYIALTVGKFSVADYFDNNKYSHDPRTQFMNWALMSNGAWDYPANTRGYTWGYVLEWHEAFAALRLSSTMVPRNANGPVMDARIKKANSTMAEIEHQFSIAGHKGTVRVLGFFTQSRMGSYAKAVQVPDTVMPDIALSRAYGRSKYGAGINFEQELGRNCGVFVRASWNDGHNETWAFTEIDHSLSAGLNVGGGRWNRPDDNFGFACVANGLSAGHRKYLAVGGNGFMLGDGKLNYDYESIAEVYYSIHLHDRHFWITPDYQFILNPGYNRDRGPIHVFALRAHVEF